VIALVIPVVLCAFGSGVALGWWLGLVEVDRLEARWRSVFPPVDGEP
jgi:hypothetical protein